MNLKELTKRESTKKSSRHREWSKRGFECNRLKGKEGLKRIEWRNKEDSKKR